MAEDRIPNPEQLRQTRRATRETKLFDQGTREEEAKEREFRRQEGLKDVVHEGSVWLIRLAPVGIAIFLLIMGWHYLGPKCCTWLTDEQIDKIEAVVTGVIISVIFIFLRRYVSPSG